MKIIDLLEASSRDLSIVLFRELMKNPPHYLKSSMNKMYGANPKFVKLNLSVVKPSQSGDDYYNESSKESAKRIKECIDNKFANLDSIRPEDILPIIVDKDFNIKDGNHRHCAATINKQEHILAFVK